MVKSFQGISVPVGAIYGTWSPRRWLLWCIYGKRWSPNNTEISEKTSDGVRSQAMTCWIYKAQQLITFMSNILEGFLSALWYCSCRRLFYKVVWKHRSALLKADFFPKTLLRYIYLTNNQRTAAFIPQDGLESCSAVRPFSSVDEWWLSLASSNRKNYCLK